MNYLNNKAEEYKNKILGETSLIASIEASKQISGRSTQGKWIKFGINNFGKSAPYKKIYDHFGLNSKILLRKLKKNYEN